MIVQKVTTYDDNLVLTWIPPGTLEPPGGLEFFDEPCVEPSIELFFPAEPSTDLPDLP